MVECFQVYENRLFLFSILEWGPDWIGVMHRKLKLKPRGEFRNR
jgi:hypothetical protein